jgi:5'-phosphate synthase pdxT subunit
MIGVLALQGNYTAHGAMLTHVGASWREVRKPAELEGLAGLIIPGGESSALLKLMTPFNWLDAIHKFHDQGGALLGTCAGLILLAKTVTPEQTSLGLLDITVERNAYGRQIDSFVGQGDITDSALGEGTLELVFIRAPKITAVGPDVNVLATYKKAPMLIQQGRVMACSFHPEMTQDTRVHQVFQSIL